MRALVVDDDLDFRSLIRVHLRQLRIDADIVATPNEFLAKLNTNEYQFCLIDLKMSGADLGFDLISKIRTSIGALLPLFVISSSGDYASIAHAIELGATDFITKPIDREILATKIAKFIPSREISQNALTLFPVPAGGAPIEVSLEVIVRAVDEFGFELESPHLFSKGRVVSLSGPTIEGITGRAEPISATIVNTRAAPGLETYLADAEFDSGNLELQRQMRSWILKMRNQLNGSK